MILAIFGFLFLTLCVYAALRDIETLTITNGLNALIAFLFVPAVIVAAPGWDVAGWHVAAGLMAFVISVLLFVGGAFGGGDAKMIPGVMLWLGPQSTPTFIAVMAIAGGGLALFVMIARRFVPAHAAPGFAHETLQTGKGVPYGVAIAAGAIACIPHSPLLQPLYQLSSLTS